MVSRLGRLRLNRSPTFYDVGPVFLSAPRKVCTDAGAVKRCEEGLTMYVLAVTSCRPSPSRRRTRIMSI